MKTNRAIPYAIALLGGFASLAEPAAPRSFTPLLPANAEIAAISDLAGFYADPARSAAANALTKGIQEKILAFQEAAAKLSGDTNKPVRFLFSEKYKDSFDLIGYPKEKQVWNLVSVSGLHAFAEKAARDEDDDLALPSVVGILHGSQPFDLDAMAASLRKARRELFDEVAAKTSPEEQAELAERLSITNAFSFVRRTVAGQDAFVLDIDFEKLGLSMDDRDDLSFLRTLQPCLSVVEGTLLVFSLATNDLASATDLYLGRAPALAATNALAADLALPLPSNTFTRISGVDFFASILRSPAVASSMDNLPPSPWTAFLKKLRGYRVDEFLETGDVAVGAVLSLVCDAPESAKEVTDMLNGVRAMAAMLTQGGDETPQGALVRKMLGGLSVAAVGNDSQIRIRIPKSLVDGIDPEALAKGLAEAAKARAAAMVFGDFDDEDDEDEDDEDDEDELEDDDFEDAIRAVVGKEEGKPGAASAAPAATPQVQPAASDGKAPAKEAEKTAE